MNFKEATNIMNAMAFVTCQLCPPIEESNFEDYVNAVNTAVRNFFETYCEINHIKEIEE